MVGEVADVLPLSNLLTSGDLGSDVAAVILGTSCVLNLLLKFTTGEGLVGAKDIYFFVISPP